MTSDFTDLNGTGGQQVWLSVSRSSQNTTNNTTTYAWELRYYGNGYGSWTNNTQYWSVNIGGATGSGTFTIPSGEAYQTYKTLGSGSVTKTHAADGTLAAFACSGAIDTDHTSIGDGTASFTEPAPPTIPRASTPTFASGGSACTTGSSKTINMNRLSTSFTHDIKWSFGTLTNQTTGFTSPGPTGIGTSVVWTPPDSMMTEVTNGVTGTGTITVTTKNGATTVGSKTLAFTVTAGSAVVPTITSVTLTEQTALVTSQVGAYVQDLSVLKGTVNSTISYGAAITSESWSTGGVSVAEGANIPLTASGTVAIGGAATDTRGRTGTYSTNITVMPYAKPTINSALVSRCNSDGSANPDNGLYVKVNLDAYVQTLMVSTQKNSMTVKISYRAYGATSWILSDTVVQAAGVVSNATFSKVLTNGTGTPAGIFPIANSFDVKIEVVDKFNTSEQILVVATAAVFMHWSATGVGIGKYHTQGSLDVAGDIYMNGLKVSTASPATETSAGVAEIATTAEVTAATDDARFVTPAKLGAFVTSKIMPPLPAPVTGSLGSSISITAAAATWADIDTVTLSKTFILTTPLWVSVEGSGYIVGAASTYGMIGVNATGALTLGPEVGFDGSTGKFGYTAYGEIAASGGKTLTFNKTLLLPVGTTTLRLQARRNVTTGTPTVGYPTITVTPIAWDGAAGAFVDDTGWLPLTLINSFTGRTGNYVPMYRMKQGIVYLSGHLIRPTAPGASPGASAFALPAGYRPRSSFHARGYDAWDVTYEIRDSTTGSDVVVYTTTQRSNATSFGYSLDGISYPAYD